MADAFYLPLGADRFLATEHTVGPWDARHQHGGPPMALLCRALQTCAARPDGVLARVTVEILGPVPVAEVRVRARVVRPGRSVELLAAELTDAAGRVVAQASAWRLARAPRETPRAPGESAPELPGPQPQVDPGPAGWVPGYLQAVEWRWVSGHLLERGPATVWGRLRHPLLPDEEPTGLQRLVAVADSGSGVSGVLEGQEWLFINPELTVHLVREPTGEWVGMRARTRIEPDGAGLATSVLYDVEGEVGRGEQALLIRRR